MAKRGSSNYAGQIGWAVGILSFLNDKSNPVERYWRVIEEGSAATKWPWQGAGIAGLWGDSAGPRGALHDTAGTRFEGRGDQKFAPYFRKREQDMLGPARAAISRFLGGGRGANMDLLKVTHVTIYRRRWMRGDRISEGGTGKPTGPVYEVERPVSSTADIKRARRALYHWYLAGASSAAQIPFVYGRIQNPVEGQHYYEKAMRSFRPKLPAMQAQAMRESLDFALRQNPSLSVTNLRKQQASDNIGGTARKGRARAERRVADLRNYKPFDTALQVIAADVTVQSLIRDDKGRFVNGTWQQALRGANARIAEQYQREVAQLMEAKGKRPSTNALVRATLDAKNRYPRDYT